MLKKIRIALFILVLLCSFSSLYAQENKTTGMPLGNESYRPAKVVVSEVTTGIIAPETEFIGTVYYQEVSDVASEVDGLVEAVNFEEGQRVKKGDVLVKLNSDLLLSDLEKAALDLDRAENLYKEDLISEQVYDERRFEVERLEIILSKKTLKAPFKGVIVKKHVDRGEWLSPGATVATIARDDSVDIIAEVPEGVIKYIKQGMDVNITAGGQKINGKVFAIIPKGDTSTRTFPVKIRVNNSMSLIEGMEARVTMPAGPREKTLIVPRDAVITVFGNTVVFAVIDSKAKMIPVNVIGYKGMTAGIYADDLKEGIKVVVKGNERLRDGQEVNIQQ